MLKWRIRKMTFYYFLIICCSKCAWINALFDFKVSLSWQVATNFKYKQQKRTVYLKYRLLWQHNISFLHISVNSSCSLVSVYCKIVLTFYVLCGKISHKWKKTLLMMSLKRWTQLGSHDKFAMAPIAKNVCQDVF